MATRVVEGKKPYTGGKAISIDENKVISLNLRDENNLIIYDAGDDEIYVDLQLDDEITPTSAFPIGVNVGRVIVDNGWDKPGTIISAETTSGDNIKIFYADEGTLWIDNGTGTFKQIYFKSDVDALLLALRNYIDGELAKKQNGVSSDTAPSNPSEGDLWYDTTNSAMKVWDGTAWQSVGTGGGGSDIEYKTQAEYDALPSSKLTDNKHYFIYSTSGGGGWQPGANTIAYYPLDSINTVNDMSGNNYTLAGTGSYNFGTYGGVDCCYINVGQLNTSGFQTISGDGPFTLSIFYYEVSAPNYDNGVLFSLTNETPSSYSHFNGSVRNNGWHGYGSGTGIVGVIDNGDPSYYTSPTYSISSGHWVHVVYVYSGTSQEIYINGSLYSSGTAGSNRPSNYTNLAISRDNGIDRSIKGYVSNAIVENKARTAQDVADYFNQTKGDYGIS